MGSVYTIGGQVPFCGILYVGTTMLHKIKRWHRKFKEFLHRITLEDSLDDE